MSQGIDPHSVPSPTVPPAPLPDVPVPTDAELLRAHVEGDTEAFAVLVRRHQDRLWAIALRVMRNPEDAADVEVEPPPP